LGACCVDEVCYETTPAVCARLESADGSLGVFWGAGSLCAGPNRDKGVYAPFNCLYGPELGGERWEGTTGGLDLQGNCLDNTGPPPCTSSCIGWQQIIGDDTLYCPDDDACPCNPPICSPGSIDPNVGCIGTCCAKKSVGGWDSCSQSTRNECASLNQDNEYEIIRWSGCNDNDNDIDCSEYCGDDLITCIGQDEFESPDVMLLADTSLQMFQGADKIKTSLISFVNQLYPQYNKIGFNDTKFINKIKVNTSLTHNYAITKEGINGMSIGENILAHPLKLVRNDFVNNSQPYGGGHNHGKILIVVSNGDLKSESEKFAANAEMDLLKDMGVEVYILGINVNSSDLEFMKGLATTPTHYNGIIFDTMKSGYNKIGHKISCGGDDVTSGFIEQSTGTIILADGNCYECCCDYGGESTGGRNRSASQSRGITDPNNLECCYENVPTSCSDASETSSMMTNCCFWEEEYQTPTSFVVGRSCKWPGTQDFPAHPWLNAETQCMSILHGTSMKDGRCEDINNDGACCFPELWSLPENISWLENYNDWQIPKAGDCITQSYGDFYAHQMNEVRCNFFGGCWIDGGDCNAGVYGGECSGNPCTECNGLMGC